MAKKIIISIKPDYVKKIIEGTKRYEYRTKAAREDVSSIIIYETYPIKRVVAEAEVIDVLVMSPSDLWKKTSKQGGISKSKFNEYFKGRELAYAYQLGNIKVYEESLSLEDFGMKCAPQSFAYIR